MIMAVARRMNAYLKHVLPGAINMSTTSYEPLVPGCFRSYSSRPTVQASPQSGLADELLDIRASGLTPGQSVVLQGEVDTECGRYRFTSRAKYTANNNGEVNGEKIVSSLFHITHGPMCIQPIIETS